MCSYEGGNLMQRKVDRNIFMPCLIGAVVGIGSFFFYQLPLMIILVEAALFVPWSICWYKKYSLLLQWVVTLTSVFAWILVVLVIGYLAQQFEWAKHIFWFPYYSKYM